MRILLTVIMLTLIGCQSSIEVDLKTLDDKRTLYLAAHSPLMLNSLNFIELTQSDEWDLYSLSKTAENVPVKWSVSGNIGSLTIAMDGKSARFSASNIGTGKISLEHNGVSETFEVKVSANTAPVINSISHQTIGQIEIGTVENLTWDIEDLDSDALVSIYLKENNTGSCNDGQLLVSNIDFKQGQYNLDTSGLDDGIKYFCVMVADGVNPEIFQFSEKQVFFPKDVCSWTGFVDNQWSNNQNWVGCSAGTPGNSSQVIMLANSLNSAQINSATRINSFAPGIGGGEIVLNSASLTVEASSNQIGSSVKIKGYENCQNCEFKTYSGSYDLYIFNNATLELSHNVTYSGYYSRHIRVGNGASPGHLKTDAGNLGSSDWTTFTGHSNARIIVNGVSSSEKSSIDFNGANIYDVTWCCGTRGRIQFEDFYEVKNFDKLFFSGRQAHFVDSAVTFKNCSNATFTDTDWTEIHFKHGEEAGDGFYLGNCSGIPSASITVSQTGQHNGGFLAHDPNGILVWKENSSTSFNCEFTGAEDSSFHKANNWSHCNDRTGVPDAYDNILVPAGKFVNIYETVIIKGISGGVGGGSIILSYGNPLMITNYTDGQIQSSIRFSASSINCSSCSVWMKGIKVTRGATLTLNDGVQFRLRTNNFSIGNSTNSAHFKVNYSGGNPAMIRKYGDNQGSNGTWRQIDVEGPVGNPSSIEIENLVLRDYSPSWTGVINFRGAYEIGEITNLNFYSGKEMKEGYGLFHFHDCTNGEFVETNWDDITFSSPISNGYNVSLTGTDCHLMSSLSITGLGTYGNDSYENDPNNLINWP